MCQNGDTPQHSSPCCQALLPLEERSSSSRAPLQVAAPPEHMPPPPELAAAVPTPCSHLLHRSSSLAPSSSRPLHEGEVARPAPPLPRLARLVRVLPIVPARPPRATITGRRCRPPRPPQRAPSRHGSPGGRIRRRRAGFKYTVCCDTARQSGPICALPPSSADERPAPASPTPTGSGEA